MSEKAAFSKNTGLNLTVGILLGVVVGAVGVGKWINETENLNTEIEDVRDRQGKYIGVDGVLTREVEDHHAAFHRLCMKLADHPDFDAEVCS